MGVVFIPPMYIIVTGILILYKSLAADKRFWGVFFCSVIFAVPLTMGILYILPDPPPESGESLLGRIATFAGIPLMASFCIHVVFLTFFRKHFGWISKFYLYVSILCGVNTGLVSIFLLSFHH